MDRKNKQSTWDSKQRQRRFRRVMLLQIGVAAAVLALLLLTQIGPLPLPQAQAQNRTSTATTTSPTEPVATKTSPTSSFEPARATTSPLATETPAALEGEIANGEHPLWKSLTGVLVLSLQEGANRHLFAYHPQSLALTRLSSGPWEDITPAISPDGNRLAFASNRNGYWDLYILDLNTGETVQLTDTPVYDASPSWSPDGQWLVYESLAAAPIRQSQEEGEGTATVVPNGGQGEQINLDLFIRPAIPSSGEAVRLTEDPGADFAPTWSAQGRQIAFVSNRSGDLEIWLADLDQIDGRFRNISRHPASGDRHPAWSPDGSKLAWSTDYEGVRTVVVKAITGSGEPAPIGSGEWPAWNAAGDQLLAAYATPNRTYLSGYSLSPTSLIIPPVPLAGEVSGMSWGSALTPAQLSSWAASIIQLTPTPLWAVALDAGESLPGQRQRVVAIDDVQAPNPMLHDLVDESFTELRQAVSNRVGWDLLASLENAFVPLTAPLAPGFQHDWLYTGRAFALNTAPLNANWLAVARQDFGTQTYWRVYLRTRYQDGTQGEPIHDQVWDFNARYLGDPNTYEQGGRQTSAVPPGYWVDFTRLAASFGWERLPALITWQSSFTAARFHEFVQRDGLDWQAAMLSIYPPEVLQTSTPVLLPTRTPTRTLQPTRTPTLTRTPWPTRTPTPSRTPRSVNTPTLAVTPTASP